MHKLLICIVLMWSLSDIFPLFLILFEYKLHLALLFPFFDLLNFQHKSISSNRVATEEPTTYPGRYQAGPDHSKLPVVPHAGHTSIRPVYSPVVYIYQNTLPV
jgi:hypothetical protein